MQTAETLDGGKLNIRVDSGDNSRGSRKVQSQEGASRYSGLKIWLLETLGEGRRNFHSPAVEQKGPIQGFGVTLRNALGGTGPEKVIQTLLVASETTGGAQSQEPVREVDPVSLQPDRPLLKWVDFLFQGSLPITNYLEISRIYSYSSSC